jgi:hypothetical protein
MVAKNEITGNLIATRGTTKAYEDNYDLIFRKPKKQLELDLGEPSVTSDQPTQLAEQLPTGN